MTYMLRDRPDGQVEIILQKPILVGIFPERDMAQRVFTMLQEEVVDLTEDKRGSLSVAAQDVADAEADDLSELMPSPAVTPPRRVRNLPAIVPHQPVAPPSIRPDPLLLTEDQKDIAFRRISEGERVSDVAREMGVSSPQLRGHWTAHKRKTQKHIAEGGQIACSGCKRPFMPSISQPYTCARCSHE